jgi:RNA polymerase sigma-70 factor (ECF subfamily)
MGKMRAGVLIAHGMNRAGGTPERDSASLVVSAQQGDRAAFAGLHARYARMVHAILVTRVPLADADDLVQDVFVTAMTRIGDLRDGGAFGAWIAQIARNRAVDFHRSKKETEDLPEALAARSGRPAEAAQALAAIRALPEAYRETLVMRLVEGMTGPEIAERTGLTEGSVRVNLHRGMKLLRERLGQP